MPGALRRDGGNRRTVGLVNTCNRPQNALGVSAPTMLAIPPSHHMGENSFWPPILSGASPSFRLDELCVLEYTTRTMLWRTIVCQHLGVVTSRSRWATPPTIPTRPAPPRLCSAFGAMGSDFPRTGRSRHGQNKRRQATTCSTTPTLLDIFPPHTLH